MAGQPKGSGLMVLSVGLAAIIIAFLGFAQLINFQVLDVNKVFALWLVFCGFTLVYWGGHRAFFSKYEDWKIGQPTIVFVLTAVSVSVAILALLLDA